MYPPLFPSEYTVPRGFHLEVICLELKVPFLKMFLAIVGGAHKCLLDPGFA